MIFHLGSTRLLSNLIRFTRQTSTLTVNNKNPFFLECRRLQNLNVLNVRSVAVSAKEKEEAQVNFIDKLEKDLHQLNVDVRMRRVFKENFRNVFENLKQSGEIKSDQLTLLLKCCTKISFMCSEKERVKMAEEFWNSAEKLGLKFEKSHFNELLNVYVGNNHKFSQDNLLKKMEKAGIEPDLVTFRYLLRASCQEGDINKAKELLEKMKNLNIPIDRLDFNSLILAYSKLGDFIKVNEILKVMESKGLKPMSVSYVYFLCGYIEHGKLEEFEKLFNQLHEKHDLTLSNLDLLEIIYTLAKNKQESYIDMVMKSLSRNADYDKHINNCVQRLLHEKLDSTALKLLESIDPQGKAFNYVLAISRFTLDHFVLYRSPKEILKICQTLEEKGYARAALGYCLKQTFFHRNKNFFMNFIQQMKAEGLPDRVHYYWPMIIKESKKGNKELLSFLKQVPPNVRQNSDTIVNVILRNYVLSDDWKADFEQLSGVGIPNIFLTKYFLIQFLKEGKIDLVEQLVSNYPVHALKLRHVFNILFTNFEHMREKSEQVANILYCLYHDVHLREPNSPIYMYSDEVVNSLLQKIKEKEIIKKVLEAMLKKKMGVSPNACSKIVEAFPNENLNDLVSSLSDPNLKIEFNETLLAVKSSTTENANHKWELKSIDSLKKCVQYMLKLADVRKFKQALEIGEAFVLQNKDISNKDIDDSEKSFKILLSKASDFEKSEKLIKDLVEFGNKVGILKEGHIHDSYFLLRNMLQRNLLARAFEIFKSIFLSTGKPVLCEDLLIKFISKGETEKVQHITDIISETHSRNTAFSYLLFALAHLNEMDKAKKVLGTPGFVFQKELFLKQLTLKGFSNTLKNLIALLKNVDNFDITDLYKILMRKYVMKHEAEKIQELWEEIQEKNLSDEEFLNAMSEFQANKDFRRLSESIFIDFSESKRVLQEKHTNMSLQSDILEEKYLTAMMGSLTPREATLLTIKFALRGNVEKTCSLLENCSIEKNAQKVAGAFLRSGNVKEYFEFLDFFASKKDFITLNKCFKIGGLLPKLLQNNNYFEKYKSLLLQCGDQTNFSSPIISCFVICAKLPRKVADAEEIVDKYSHHFKDITFSELKKIVELTEFSKNFYENILSSKKLKALFAEHIHEFYNQIITLKYEENKVQEALRYLNQAEADNVKEKLDKALITRMKTNSKHKKVQNQENSSDSVD